MKRESNAIDVVLKKHIGTKVLVRLVNQAFPKEGVIDELSEEKLFFRVGNNWLPNGEGYVLAVLGKAKKRRSVL